MHDLICLRVANSREMDGFQLQNQLIFMRDENETEAKLFSPRILTQLANLDAAREWMDYCRHNHPHCQVRSGSTIGLQLIDCNTQLVVRASAVEYLALSYVWGSVQHHQTAATFPKTIMDAVCLTKALGFRYLWVDQYCIDQNSKEEKHNQIQQMDLIYQNAFLTIVAASGSDSNSGIAGVQGTLRKRQPIQSVGYCTLINTLARPHHTISKSIWSTRGWTLQEAAVTKRKLVFTEEQIYFECGAMSCHESIKYDLSKLHDTIKHGNQHILPVESLGNGEAEDGLRPTVVPTIADRHARFLSLRQQYIKRQLTYESDSLNAFLGILKQLELPAPSKDDRRMCWLVFIWGVPYENSSTSTSDDLLRSFMEYLLWIHPSCSFTKSIQRTEATRRYDFPSWS
jgi:hypothetical protein